MLSIPPVTSTAAEPPNRLRHLGEVGGGDRIDQVGAGGIICPDARLRCRPAKCAVAAAGGPGTGTALRSKGWCPPGLLKDHIAVDQRDQAGLQRSAQRTQVPGSHLSGAGEHRRGGRHRDQRQAGCPTRPQPSGSGRAPRCQTSTKPCQPAGDDTPARVLYLWAATCPNDPEPCPITSRSSGLWPRAEWISRARRSSTSGRAVCGLFLSVMSEPPSLRRQRSIGFLRFNPGDPGAHGAGGVQRGRNGFHLAGAADRNAVPALAAAAQLGAPGAGLAGGFDQSIQCGQETPIWPQQAWFASIKGPRAFSSPVSIARRAWRGDFGDPVEDGFITGRLVPASARARPPRPRRWSCECRYRQ